MPAPSVNSGCSVARDVVFEHGVARKVKRPPVGVVLEILGAEGDALVEHHVIADDGSGSDDDARAVVDGEVFADLRARMDVDTGGGMRHLREEARGHGDLQVQQLMRRAVVEHHLDAGVAEHDLRAVFDGGVILGDGFYVSVEQPGNQGDALHEGVGLLVAGQFADDVTDAHQVQCAVFLPEVLGKYGTPHQGDQAGQQFFHIGWRFAGQAGE